MEVNSRYQRLQKTLNDLKCPVCDGSGKLLDKATKGIVDPDWQCDPCKGSGVKQGVRIVMAIQGEKP